MPAVTSALHRVQIRRTSRCAWMRFTAVPTRNGSIPMLTRRETVDGASFVWQRGEDEVAGEGRLHRDLRRLVVPDLADQDDVRVLPQELAERRGEGQAHRLPICTWLTRAG